MSPTLAAALAFNLVCSGTLQVSDGQTRHPPIPFERTYRIDFGLGRYCKNECEETLPLARVSATEIVFVDDTLEDGAARVVESVNRESGTLHGWDSYKALTISEKGKCTRGSFTGLPKRQF